MESFRSLMRVISVVPFFLIIHLLLTPLSVVCQQVTHVPADNVDPKKFVQQFQSGIQVSFTENRGQWDSAILYQASTTRGNIFLTNTGIQYSIRRNIEHVRKENQHLALTKKESAGHESLFWN